MVESALCFFTLTSLYFYLTGLEKNSRGDVFLSGIVSGFAFLTTCYRVATLPVFILLLEIYFYRTRKDLYKKDKARYPIYLVSAVVPILVYQSICLLLRWVGVLIPSFFQGMKFILRIHKDMSLDFFSFLTYPYCLLILGGVGINLSGLVALLKVYLLPCHKHCTLISLKTKACVSLSPGI